MQLGHAPFVTPARTPRAQLLHELRARGDLRRRPEGVIVDAEAPRLAGA